MIPSSSSSDPSPFEYIRQCYDPSHANYRFRFYFYNPIIQTDGIPIQIVKPAGCSDALWQQIQADNPDPALYAPALADGFDALKQRSEWLQKTHRSQQEKLAELQNESARLLSSLELDATGLLRDARSRQDNLTARFLRVMRVIEAMREDGLPGRNGLPLPMQEQIKALLEKVREQRIALDKAKLNGEPSQPDQVASFNLDLSEELYRRLTSQQKLLEDLTMNLERDDQHLHLIRNTYEQIRLQPAYFFS